MAHRLHVRATAMSVLHLPTYILRALLVAATLALLAGCDEAWLSCDEVAGMLESDGGLEVTEDEHPSGWAQEACSTCHSSTATHRRNCTGLDEVDLAAIRDAVEEDGDDSCGDCHGDNGTGR
jgi:hypothetical protein